MPADIEQTDDAPVKTLSFAVRRGIITCLDPGPRYSSAKWVQQPRLTHIAKWHREEGVDTQMGRVSGEVRTLQPLGNEPENRCQSRD